MIQTVNSVLPDGDIRQAAAVRDSNSNAALIHR